MPSPPRPGPGSAPSSRTARHRSRSAPGRPSTVARTRWSSRPPVRARRWPPSCPPSIGSSGTHRPVAARPGTGARPATAAAVCGCCTYPRSRPWASTSSGTCDVRWPGSPRPPRSSEHRSFRWAWACARAILPPPSAVVCAPARRTSSSRRRNPSTSCSPPPCGGRCAPSRPSSSMRSTPSPPPSAALTWRCPWSASTTSSNGRPSASACPRPSPRARRSPASSAEPAPSPSSPTRGARHRR